ncbi:MAG: sortase [bacterium]|nr:sortase [bacterium]
MKKFIIYFCLIFIASFTLLNVRFVSAQMKFWFFAFSSSEENDTAYANDGGWMDKMHDQSTEVTRTLPLSDAMSFFLEIPAIGVKAPVVLEKSVDSQKIFDRLEEGVVHYSDSPLPGQRGTAIILGHSSAYPWYKGDYGSIFALLGKLKAGDQIYVNDSGKMLTYSVTESVIFNPFSHDKSVDQIVATDNSSIILVSCWPVGTNSKRIAVKADLLVQ